MQTPSPSLPPPSGETFDTLKTVLTFVAGMFGAVLGTPVIEWFKDRLGAKRQWQNQQNEIICTVRLVMGILGAFHDIREKAFPDVTDEILIGRASVSKLEFELLKKFDLHIISESIPKLSALAPADSKRSQAAQRFIEHLVTVRSYFEALQTIVPIDVVSLSTGEPGLGLLESDKKLVRDGDQCFTHCKQFLAGYYGPKLGFKSFSTILDPEIWEFEDRIRAYELEAGQKKIREAMNVVKEKKMKTEQTNTPDPQPLAA
jgi:hypothetical protein